MSSFSQFLKQLPFSPQRFRQSENETEALKSVRPDLAGITINVYELEIKGGSGDEEEGYEETLSLDNSTTSEVESSKEDLTLYNESQHKSRISVLNQLRYANIVVFCPKCRTEVPVCTLQYHRRKYQALQTLRYSGSSPPLTVRSLLRRRNKAMEELQKKSFREEGQLIRNIHKINVAFELIKKELEGIYDGSQITRIGNWKEKDIKATEKTLNRSMSLGVSRYRKPESNQSNTKCVYVDNFLASGKGIFLGIYQGYSGDHVTYLCKRDLHKEIQNELRSILETEPSSEQIKAVIQNAYQNIDKTQLISDEENSWNRWSGCSAVTCLLLDNKIYIANEGNLQGLLIRKNNTVKVVTSCHDLYNRKERQRVRKTHGLVVKTDKCALVNGVLETTRGLGNLGDWRLKACVINKARVRMVSLKNDDKMLVLASEGLWKVFHHREIVFLINKFLRDALSVKLAIEKEEAEIILPPIDYLGVNPAKEDKDFKYFAKQNKNKGQAIDFNVPNNINWREEIPDIGIRRATIVVEEALLEATAKQVIQKRNFSRAEKNDEDIQKMANILSTGEQYLYARREISRLLSKRLLKSALIAGADTNTIVMVLLLQGFKIE